MKLHWFSPLPPARTGIAEYSVMLAPWLSQVADVTFWTDQKSWDPRLEAHGKVRRYSPDQVPWEDLNQGVSVFHIGNNPSFHQSIWRVSQAHAGVVVLHDVRLQDFFWGILARPGDAGEYVRCMERVYGRAGASAAGLGDASPDLETVALPYPLFEPAIENALGVVVHTATGRDLVDPRCPCALACMPLAYDPTQARRPVKAPGPPHELVVFGFINPNRRLISLLRALGEMPDKDAFRLRVCGRLWDETHVRAKIREYGLERHVTLQGYMTALDEAIARADLAINLRFPSMGEASGSQLRIWDHALPSIVTRTGWYAGLPSDAVLHVDVETEIDDLKRHLSAFVSDPAAFRKMGERGRDLLALHEPGQYVRNLMKFASQAATFRPTRAWLKTGQRVGLDMRCWASAMAVDSLASAAASAIPKVS